MNTEFVLMAQAHYAQNPLLEIVRCMAPHPCYWQESRILRMGQEVVLMARLSGSWDIIAKIELALQGLEKKAGIRCVLSRTQERVSENTLYPYNVQIIAPNMPGHVPTLIQFFLDQAVVIEEVITDPYLTHTETAMISLGFNIGVPYDIQISELRERFLILCDSHNMDGLMEPVKG